MIKAMMPGDGEEPDVLFLGLSGENITRLVAGEPILIGTEDMARLGLPRLKLVICYGKTEQTILAELAAQRGQYPAGWRRLNSALLTAVRTV